MLSNNVEFIFYLVSTIAVLGGAATYIERKYSDARRRWQEETREKVHLSEAVEANSTATAANTQALANFSRRMERFCEETTLRLDDDGRRITRLEDHVNGGEDSRRR